MAYNKTTWKDNEAPYLNATNLNKIESGIDNNDTQIEQNATHIEQNATDIADNRIDIDINTDNILGLTVGEVYQGTWTPEAGTEYPDSPEGGWSYYIQFLDDDGYTFTTGDLSGRIANNSDKIIYNGTSWSMIDNTNEQLGYYLVDDIESMLGLSPLQGALCEVYGYSSANDGGGGTFNYDSSFSGTNNGGTILDGWVRQYSGSIDVRWFGANIGATDNSTAINNAIAVAGNGTVLIPEGTYECTSEILIITSVTLIGEGKGYMRNLLAYDPSLLIPSTRLLFKGTGTKSIKTRVNYRGSISDPADDPISAGINIQMDGVTIRDLMVELYCDYTDTSPTNYGDDWDVGIFHGSRQDLLLEDVNVVGYWSGASIWLDSTRGVNLPELNGYPVTFGAGADGIKLLNVQTTGGMWGVKKQGPLPKDGFLHFGFQYLQQAEIEFDTGVPAEGDTATVDGNVYTFTSTPVTKYDVLRDANTLDTVNGFIEVLLQDEISPFYNLTFSVEGISGTYHLFITSTSSTNTPISATGSLIATDYANISDPAPYYDDATGLVDDGRNSLGASDFVVDSSVILATEHHSKYRRNDYMSDFATDVAGGSLLINGLGGAAVIHKAMLNKTRFQSAEPFNVKVVHGARVRVTDCVFDSNLTNWLTTSGGAISASDSYGQMAIDDIKTALVSIIGFDEPKEEYFARNKNSNQLYTDFYLQGYDANIDRHLTVGLDAIIGDKNSDTDTGALTVLSGVNANSELIFGNEKENTGRIRTSSAGAITISEISGGSLTNAMYLTLNSSLIYSSWNPATDALNLGTSSLPWDIVFSNRYYAGATAGVQAATFTTSDGKTVTVTGGIITSIV